MISQRLDTIIEIIKRRKIVFITLAVLLIVIITALSLFLNSQNSPSANTPTPIPEKTNNSTGQTIMHATIGPVNSNLPKWTTYKGNSFSLQHPADWSLQNGEIAGGGELVIIKPNILPAEINYPYFIIQTQPAKQGVLEQKAEILRALGLEASERIIFGQKASKLSGTISIKNVGGIKVNEPIQETTILFSHGDYLYTFKYAYEGSTSNADLENYFEEFIKGIKLNK